MNIKNNSMTIPLKEIKRCVMQNLHNSKGWITNKKYIVIESDDWGSIRTASPKAYEILIKAGDKTDSDPFTKYDALASDDDLELLFDVLSHFKDKNGNHPIFTANCAVANPDFDKIRESNFENYYYEKFTETLNKYSRHSKCFQLWKKGLESKVFFPQLHCREHLNIIKWLHDLRNNDKDLLLAFDNYMISGGNSFSRKNKYAYMDAFNYSDAKYDDLINNIISNASDMFYTFFGYKSKSFVAPCYVWNNSLENIIKNNNIDFIQGSHYQMVPSTKGYECYDKKMHIIGENNKNDLLYLVRNCSFEPSMGNATKAVDSCMAQIENSFIWKKPVTICTHRLNYIGYIDESNRDINLRLLKQLFKKILSRWPDIEFITSTELGNIISDSKKSEFNI